SFSSRRRHTRSKRDWSSDVCSSDLRCTCMSTPADDGPPGGGAPTITPEAAVSRALTLVDEALRTGSRRILGIAGAPGAGKSTLTALLAERLPAGTCTVVPMDGFHLADVALERLGRLDRKIGRA